MKARWPFAALLLLPALTMPAQYEAPAVQTSAPGDVGADPAGTLRLDDVVKQALEKNPEAQSELHGIAALKLRVPQARALPDPTVSVGWAGNLAPFSLQSGDPSSSRAITVGEQFPYPGKLKLQGEIASKDADAAQAGYEAVERRVAAGVKSTFYDYSYFDQAIRTTQQDKDLLEKLSKIAEARYRVGKAMQSDVLRSQVEISLLLEKLTQLEQQRGTAQARLNAYLQRPPESPLPPAEAVVPQSIRYSLDQLYALAASNDTAVELNQRMVERGQLSVALAERAYRPDIGVGYMFQQRNAQMDMNGLTVSVSIPIFYKTKQREGVAEASEDLLSAENMRDNRLNEVRFELKQQYLAAKASERLMSLYTTGIVPQTSLALESSMSAYQVGNLDFSSMLANFTTLLSYETEYYRQVADHETAIAQMESLTGVSIAGAPIASSPADSAQPAQEEK
jgi:outer membrane protein TolC